MFPATKVTLPANDELVRALTEMLSVLNRMDKRVERYNASTRRAAIPSAQLEDRARQIAQWLLTLPSA